MTYIFLVAFVLIMVGELADKSQLLALLLATRYKAWQVLVGIFIATFVVHFFTTLVGQFLGSAIPHGVIPWMTGILFIGFGIWTLRGDKVEDERGREGRALRADHRDDHRVLPRRAGRQDADHDAGHLGRSRVRRVLVYLKGAGPTVQSWLATVGSPENVSQVGRFWAVTMGSTIGMVVADAIAIGIGRLLGKNMPELLMRRVSGVIFIVFGLLSIGSMLFRG